MFLVPKYLKPKKSIIKLLRINAGLKCRISSKRLMKLIDIYQEPLPLVFLLAMAVYISDKKSISKHLMGVIEHAHLGNFLTMAAFQKICKTFNKQNIPVLAEKGLVYKLLHPNTVRPMNDADFAVPKDLYRKAVNIAIQTGFHLNHDMTGSADMQYEDKGCIDIHYSLFKGSNPELDKDIFSRAKEIDFNDCKVLVPIPEDRIVIIMCEFYGNFLYEAGTLTADIHNIFKEHPQWALDIFGIIKNNRNLNWGHIMKVAEKSKCSYQIKILSKILNTIFPGIISEHMNKVMDFMCPDSVVNLYLNRDLKIMRLNDKSTQWFQQDVKKHESI